MRTFERYSDEILEVKIKAENEAVGVTPEHPFYVRVHGARSNLEGGDEDGEWKSAKNLQAGDEVLQADGSWSVIESVTARESGAKVYNFEVADNHNYFVGENGTLVHNQCDGKLARYKDIDYAERVAARAARMSVNRALATGITGNRAGWLAESIFEKYAYQMNQRLMAINSPSRITTQVASSINTGERVFARTRGSFRGRWNREAKRLDYAFYNKYQGNANNAPVISGGDFTVTRGAASNIPEEYAPTFPSARIYGIDRTDIEVGP